MTRIWLKILYVVDLVRSRRVSAAKMCLAMRLERLGGLALRSEKFSIAERRYQEALSIMEETFGTDITQVAGIRLTLGTIYQGQQRFDEAETMLSCALEINEKALGPDHPHVAADLRELGIFLQNQERYPEVVQLYQRVVSM